MALSKKTIDFLIENRLRDSKAWFDEHRQIYRETVLEPLQQLVGRLGSTMLEIDPQLTVDPSVG